VTATLRTPLAATGREGVRREWDTTLPHEIGHLVCDTAENTRPRSRR